MPPIDDESNPELVIHLRPVIASPALWNDVSHASGRVGVTVLVYKISPFFTYSTEPPEFRRTWNTLLVV